MAKILKGQEALNGFAKGVSRLLENRKLHYRTSFQNIPISVENRRGSVRSGTDKDGSEWRTKMRHPYGYIPGTKGADGDALDVFVGPHEHASHAYVVHSMRPDTGKFDEDKVMLGFRDKQHARDVFHQHYDDPKFYGGLHAIPMWQFREKAFIRKHTTRKLVASMRESMKRDILGNHQAIPINPEVREGGPGSGRHSSDIETNQHSGGVRSFKGPGGIHAVHPLGDGKNYAVYKYSPDLDKGRKLIGTFDNQLNAQLIARGASADEKKKESREGGPGSGRHHDDFSKKYGDTQGKISAFGGAKFGEKMSPKEAIEKAGARYEGSMEHPKGGRLHMFTDPKTGSSLALHDSKIEGPETVKDHMHDSRRKFGKESESREHGVLGMHWGNSKGKSEPPPRSGHYMGMSDEDFDKYRKKTLLHDMANSLGDEFDRLEKERPAPKSQASEARESGGYKKKIGRFLREARKHTVYYARSLQRYESGAEAREVDQLKEAYPDSDIKFPATRRHAELGMDYFHKKIDKCDEVVITPLRKNRVTAGVFSEAQHALHKGIPVRVLRNGKLRRVKKMILRKDGNAGGEYARFVLQKKRKKK